MSRKLRAICLYFSPRPLFQFSSGARTVTVNSVDPRAAITPTLRIGRRIPFPCVDDGESCGGDKAWNRFTRVRFIKKTKHVRNILPKVYSLELRVYSKQAMRIAVKLSATQQTDFQWFYVRSYPIISRRVGERRSYIKYLPL